MKKFCVIGTPVGHSRSPELFERFSSERGYKYGADVEYLRNEIQTKEELSEFVRQLKSGEWKGCNVTMPWKTDMVGYMDELSETARLTDSVNTVSFRKGKLYGDSTDGRGMLNAVAESISQAEELKISYKAGDKSFVKTEPADMRGTDMVILGCGGAARSIIAEAVIRKFKSITIVCRGGAAVGAYENDSAIIDDVDKDREAFSPNIRLTLKMLDKLGKTGTKIKFIDSGDTGTIAEAVDNADLLINSTPVGMKTGNGDELKLPLPETIAFKRGLIVGECIYNPDETRLTEKARASGCTVVKGIRMLEEQARCGVDVLLSE
jgi:shikimate dehydrogenase